MDELQYQYVSTIPYNEKMVETNLSCNSQCTQVIGNETMEVANSRWVKFFMLS